MTQHIHFIVTLVAVCGTSALLMINFLWDEKGAYCDHPVDPDRLSNYGTGLWHACFKYTPAFVGKNYKECFWIVYEDFYYLRTWIKTARPKSKFEFASYYSSNMVLQRAPARPRIWGYAVDMGEFIIVNVETGFQNVSTHSIAGPEGRPIWEVVLKPIVTVGPHTITVQSGSTVITLTNILVGDVWICSGQSNMHFRFDKMDNYESDLADVVNYPDVRIFSASLEWSNKPQYDLISADINWASPTSENIRGFSAVCFLFGRNLYRKYGRPVGMIESSFGGTRIEAWMSEETLPKCFNSIVLQAPPNGPSNTYNTMIHPFIPMPIFGMIWYQGENNAYHNQYLRFSAERYSCAIKTMVNDWRKRWHERSPEMDSTFPFGQVQLAPNRDVNVDSGFPDVRWAQTDGFGYVPNANMTKHFIAVTIDLADFNSPHGPVHGRHKRQIADRLALGAYNIAYGSTDTGIFQGPRPITIAVEEGGNVLVTYDTDVYYNTTYPSSFELCCGDTPTSTCSSGGLWTTTLPIETNVRSVVLSNPCQGRNSLTGFRYLWRESPCLLLKHCPIYSQKNDLPAPPYIYNGLIKGNTRINT